MVGTFTDRDHADDPDRPVDEDRDRLLRNRDPRVLTIDKDYGRAELDRDGDIADETPGHRH